MALLREQMKQELARKKQAQQQPPGYRQMEAGRPPQQGEQVDPTNATQEEQAIYEKVVLGGMRILYDDNTHKDVMKMLGSADPATSMGELVAIIVQRIDEMNQGRIPDTVILPAAMEIMDAASELAQAAGLFKVDAQLAENATHVLVARLANIYGLDEAEVQQILQENVPSDQLYPAGEEASQSPMRWKPYKDMPEPANDEAEPPAESARPGEEEGEAA